MTIHTKAAWQKEGATCAEAFARTVDPAHQQSMRLPVQRIIVGSRDDGIGGHNFDRNQNERERANRLARASFVGFLRTGVLIATGHSSVMQDEEPAAINSSAWNNLLPSWSKNCAMNGKVQERFGLCIFPLLSSPVAARQLVGLSLMDAFSKFVANDPEFLASVKREGAVARQVLGCLAGYDHPVFNRQGCFWNVSLTVPADRGPVGFLSNGPEDNTARAARLVVMDRLSALFDLLRRGKIIASGHGGDGQRIDISPALWQSRRCYVDFDTGEFFQLSASEAPELFASGVSIEAAKPPQEEMTTTSDIDGLPKPLEDELYKRWVERIYNSNPNAFEKLSPRGEKAKLARQLERIAKASGKTWKFDSLRDALGSLLAADKAKRKAPAGERQKVFKVVNK